MFMMIKLVPSQNQNIMPICSINVYIIKKMVMILIQTLWVHMMILPVKFLKLKSNNSCQQISKVSKLVIIVDTIMDIINIITNKNHLVLMDMVIVESRLNKEDYMSTNWDINLMHKTKWDIKKMYNNNIRCNTNTKCNTRLKVIVMMFTIGTSIL